MQPARSTLNYRARYRHVRHYRAAHDKTRAAAYFKRQPLMAWPLSAKNNFL